MLFGHCLILGAEAYVSGGQGSLCNLDLINPYSFASAALCFASGSFKRRISSNQKAWADALFIARILSETPRHPIQVCATLSLKCVQKTWACKSPSSISRSASCTVLLAKHARFLARGILLDVVTRSKTDNGVATAKSVFHLSASVREKHGITKTRREISLAPDVLPSSHGKGPRRICSYGNGGRALQRQAGWYSLLFPTNGWTRRGSSQPWKVPVKKTGYR